MIRLFLVDDHPVVRQGLRTALESESDLQVVGEADSFPELAASTVPFDVAVLDLEMPGPDPLERRLPFPAVIFTAHGERQRVSQALRQGALSYVLKGAPLAELVAAIRAAATGETFLPPRVAALVAQALRSPAPELTPRQTQILRLVADGKSNKEIAALLHLSERTAKFHLTGLFNRLGADNRAQAVALATRAGLL